MSKQPSPAPTASAKGPCPTIIKDLIKNFLLKKYMDFIKLSRVCHRGTSKFCSVLVLHVFKPLQQFGQNFTYVVTLCLPN